MAVVARRMNLSVRTLRRRLAQQNTSFRAVAQDVQRHLAAQYLRETTLAIADVAQLLGYFDTPTFSRAFKSWTGSTPRAFRDRATALPISE
jgi:AraC-like DNA-binding protein